MFGFNYIKFQPSEYIIYYSKGKVKKQGPSLSFYYYTPTTTIVALPIGSKEVPFIFEEITSDFQTITVQGNVSYKIKDMSKLAEVLNFNIDLKTKKYLSEDPSKLSSRIINITRVLVKNHVEKLDLKDVIKSSETLSKEVTADLKNNPFIDMHGLEIMGFSVLAIKPNAETSRALEAKSREEILKRADEAIYERRNSAILQERKIKENELNTEIAIVDKRREIKEAELASEVIYQQKKNMMEKEQLQFTIEQEERNKELVALEVENNRIKAEAKAYELEKVMGVYAQIDQNTLKVLGSMGMNSGELIAQAFQDLANNASKIGELNISPELLHQLTKGK